MPDVNRDEEEQTGSATGAPQQAAFQPAQQQEHVPWSSFVNANKDVSDREAEELRSGVQGNVDKAKGGLSDAQSAFNTGIDANYKPKAKKPVARGFDGVAGAVTDSPTQPELQAYGGNQNVTQFRPPAPQKDNPNMPVEQPVLYSQANTASQAPASSAPAAQPTTGNPWAAFLPAEQGVPAAAPAGLLAPAGGMETIKRLSNLAPGAAAGNPVGPHDLEGAASADAWSKLLGDSLRASNEAAALGDEAGVEALLQKRATSPTNTGFDAALINGSGHAAFGDLNRKYGDNQLGKGIIDAQEDAQGRWAQLQGEVAERQGLDKLIAGLRPEEAPTAADSEGAAEVVPEDVSPIASTKWTGLTGNPDDITGNAGSGADTMTWGDNDEAAFQDALAAAKGPLDQNNGEVVFGAGPSNEGIGNGGRINVNWGKTKNQDGTTAIDFAGWWGGATDMRIGDQRIPAATWYALAMLSPRQRALWWAKNGSNFG